MPSNVGISVLKSWVQLVLLVTVRVLANLGWAGMVVAETGRRLGCMAVSQERMISS